MIEVYREWQDPAPPCRFASTSPRGFLLSREAREGLALGVAAIANPSTSQNFLLKPTWTSLPMVEPFVKPNCAGTLPPT